MLSEFIGKILMQLDGVIIIMSGKYNANYMNDGSGGEEGG